MIKTDVIKRGDNATLLYRANADLTEATALKWLARRSPDGPLLLQRTATVVSTQGATSVIAVELTPTETAQVGLWLVELEVTISGKTRTFPSEGYLHLKVIDDLS
jgi:hypothetical protein